MDKFRDFVFGLYEGTQVPLETPMLEAAEGPELNSPKRSGLSSKINDPEARASFAARHDCANKTDKTSPGYWSCRLPRYAKQLGLGTFELLM